jgi:tRNA (guanine37-N1)-methyltransferase
LEGVDLRAFTDDKHRSVDNTLYGGKQGMLFKPDVLDRALSRELEKVGGDRSNLRVLYPSPRGMTLDQGIVDAMAEWLGGSVESGEPRRLSIICGRYEGIDERIVDRWVDFEFSIGDFVLTGGELPALLLTDAVTRLVPGVLGNEESSREDSFKNGLLEHPQFTKPREFRGAKVPESLLSGVHQDIEEWKLRESLMVTFAFRPDLIRAHRGQGFPRWARELLERLQKRLEIRESDS